MYKYIEYYKTELLNCSKITTRFGDARDAFFMHNLLLENYDSKYISYY